MPLCNKKNDELLNCPLNLKLALEIARNYPNNIIMNKNAKKMYVAPSIKEHVIELEQGIAAGSGGNAGPTGTPTSNDRTDEMNGSYGDF